MANLVFLEFYSVFSSICLAINTLHKGVVMPQYNGWSRDERIDEDSAMRLLEKKIHYLMGICSNAGIMNWTDGNSLDLPNDIADDAGDFGSGAPKGQV
jgi:hypothetical protein